MVRKEQQRNGAFFAVRADGCTRNNGTDTEELFSLGPCRDAINITSLGLV